jgi:Transcriptional regulator, AbiEi antitoxin
VGELVDAAIAAIAGRQHGYIRREQLLRLGLTPSGIDHRIRSGRLVRVYAGVYAVGAVPTLPVARAAAAVLACGPGAALSHLSALCLWGWRKPWDVPFHVTAPSNHVRPGIRVHCSTALARRDIRTHLGIRVTSPARTLLDVAPRLSDPALRRVVREARLSPYMRESQLADVVARFPRHPGAARLKPLIEAPSGPTRSEFEDGFLAFCADHGLPRPRTNVRIAGHLVDAVFDVERLIVELDGFEFHGGRDSFESDRDRDADTLRVGHATVRITWQRMTKRPRREAKRLLAILENRR